MSYSLLSAPFTSDVLVYNRNAVLVASGEQWICVVCGPLVVPYPCLQLTCTSPFPSFSLSFLFLPFLPSLLPCLPPSPPPLVVEQTPHTGSVPDLVNFPHPNGIIGTGTTITVTTGHNNIYSRSLLVLFPLSPSNSRQYSLIPRLSLLRRAWE